MPRVSTSKTRHNPEDLTTIRGYPDTLKLFRMPASKFWYVRMFIYGRGIVKKSTRCEKLSDAREFAISWYEDRLLEKKQHKAIGSQSFAVFAARLQETQKRQISRGELVPEMAAYDKQRLDRDVLPRFGTTHIAKIDYKSVDEFIDDLKNDRDLAQSTLKKYVVLIRKVMKEAEREGVLDHIPSLPTVKRNDTPRPWFSPEEYQQVLNACRELRDNPPPRYQFDFAEMYDFIVFMIHTFLRPSEWKMLQNKHIRFLQQDGIEQLVISVAQYNLGLMYEQGKGVTQDYWTAAKWYRLAAEQGDTVAQYKLGVMYAFGKGVLKDYVYAHMWGNLAAANRNKAGEKLRDDFEKKMTPAQIADAQKLARECVRKKYKGC